MSNLLEGAALAGIGLLALGLLASGAGPTPPHAQPIAFPHDLHWGLKRMDCLFCHASAPASENAGLPDLKLCADCHMPGGEPLVRTDRPEVKKLIAYWRAGKPIPWVSIYELADHVHFPHMRHVAMGSSGAYCQECHGPIQAGRDLGLREPLTMSWCIACHELRGARTDCVACHYPGRVDLTPAAITGTGVWLQ